METKQHKCTKRLHHRVRRRRLVGSRNVAARGSSAPGSSSERSKCCRLVLQRIATSYTQQHHTQQTITRRHISVRSNVHVFSHHKRKLRCSRGFRACDCAKRTRSRRRSLPCRFLCHSFKLTGKAFAITFGCELLIEAIALFRWARNAPTSTFWHFGGFVKSPSWPDLPYFHGSKDHFRLFFRTHGTGMEMGTGAWTKAYVYRYVFF